MAAIAVVYPCLLAYMIYVHNKNGELEVPQILMKYGHFFTGARRRPSAMALYRPEISAHNTWHTCRLQAERLAALFLWATKLSREPFVRTHPGRLPAVCYVTSCDCTHARTRTCMHAHTYTRTRTSTCICRPAHARTHARRFIRTHRHAHRHARTHTRMHTHARTHASTHTCAHPRRRLASPADRARYGGKRGQST